MLKEKDKMDIYMSRARLEKIYRSRARLEKIYRSGV